ncbi:MAG: MoaD/ThiS family protein [Nitrospiraceae bacterium]
MQVEGSTLADILAALDRRFPGIRFRIITEQDTIRPHIRIFVNEQQILSLTAPLRQEDRIYIVCALSGG